MVMRRRTHDNVTELEGLVLTEKDAWELKIKKKNRGRTYGEKGLHKFAHNSPEE